MSELIRVKTGFPKRITDKNGKTIKLIYTTKLIKKEDYLEYIKTEEGRFEAYDHMSLYFQD